MDDLRAKWADLKRRALMSPSHLRALAFAARAADGAVPLRSLRWRLYLDALPIEQFGQDDAACWRVWAVAADRERQTYAELKAQLVVDPNAAGCGAADLKRMNPLSLDEDSPWSQYHRDQELRSTIQQDVARTFPDEAYFGTPRVQRLLADMLLVYAKMHSALRYRQGMHELLAPLLLAVDRDAVDADDDCALAGVLDRRFVEHDAFALFGRLMRLCTTWYQVPSPAPAAAPAQTPIVAQCYLMLEKLELVDPQLCEHLQRLDIEPQLFGIRWYRLLFSRELARLDDVLLLWDALFADSATGLLRLVDWIAVVLLLASRRRLLRGDYEDCLSTLLHLPPLPLPAPDVLERTPALPNALMPPAHAGRPVLADAVVLAPKIPYAALALPATAPVQRLALQAAYLRSRPTADTAALVARQYELWEEDAWDVVEDTVPPPVSSLPVAVPQNRRTRAQHQQTRGTSLPSASPRSPRSMLSSPPLPASCLVPLAERRSAQSAEFYGGVRSPGEAAMALGSVTAQAASIAAQCLDMAADGADGGQQAIEDVAAALHALSRVWQEEVVKSAADAPAATAECDLRDVLHRLDRIHISLSKPVWPDPRSR